MSNFIPKQYRKEQISISLDVEILKTVEQAAKDWNLSRNAFIGQCIEYALTNMKAPTDSSQSENQP
ncbi:ribbon-helix-helix domain-containing protein [Butyricicoccus faecihominis]|uniref:ribbon-helix-helix domain-containing protein n=1 Tax=Butyricicoccus faecihominis TaxID=1712515 RepID=UPI0024798B5C|nr:ribbon-helix-helix domain-containing protein [Butyricicoccus faecihominis]MCQ5131034.1 ribbon-helix-helix domain-containing protein [Butyricicoccus faecihominis]